MNALAPILTDYTESQQAKAVEIAHLDRLIDKLGQYRGSLAKRRANPEWDWIEVCDAAQFVFEADPADLMVNALHDKQMTADGEDVTPPYHQLYKPMKALGGGA